MSKIPAPTPRRRASGRSALAFQETQPVRVVWLRIALSARFLAPNADIDRRLCAFLRPSGITCWMADRAVALMRDSRPITPAEWSAVIGWLLCQPEVVFVARELPGTHRTEVRQ